MYCEVLLKHRKPVSPGDLVRALKESNVGQEIALGTAYSFSQLYSIAPPTHSYFSHETARGCFIILRQVNRDESTFHIEGMTRAVEPETLFSALEAYARHLLDVVNEKKNKKQLCGAISAFSFFEGDGKPIPLDAHLVTLPKVLRDTFSWSEIRSSLIPFLTVLFVVKVGLKEESLSALAVALVITSVFLLTESLTAYFQKRGKIVVSMKME